MSKQEPQFSKLALKFMKEVFSHIDVDFPSSPCLDATKTTGDKEQALAQAAGR